MAARESTHTVESSLVVSCTMKRFGLRGLQAEGKKKKRKDAARDRAACQSNEARDKGRKSATMKTGDRGREKNIYREKEGSDRKRSGMS